MTAEEICEWIWTVIAAALLWLFYACAVLVLGAWVLFFFFLFTLPFWLILWLVIW